MTKLHLWLCFFALALCYGLTRALLHPDKLSKPKVSVTGHNQTNEKLETSLSVNTFRTTSVFDINPFETKNSADFSTDVSFTVEESSEEESLQENTSTSKTAVLSDLEQLHSTTVAYVESIQCVNASNLRVENVDGQKTRITWDLESDNTSSICLSFDVMNYSSSDSENCSNRFCNEIVFTEYYPVLCPYQEYTISIQTECSSTTGVHEISTLYKTEPVEPSVPLNFTVIIKNTSSLLLSWLPPEKPGGPIDGYILKYFKFNTTQEEELVIVPDMTIYSIHELEAGSSYNILLYAFNLVSNRTLKSPAIEEHVVMPEIPGPPENMSIVRVTNTSITVKWGYPKNSKGIILKYSLKWINETRDISSTMAEFSISSLQPFENYRISVSASMNGGEGPSLTLDVQTDVSAPSPPTNVTVLSKSPRVMLVSWDEPLTKNGPISGYVIDWKSENGLADNTTVSGEIKNFLLTNLDPYTNYSINVSAYNINCKNESLISEEVSVNASTWASSPSAPTNFTVHEKYHSYLLVMWFTPEVPNGPINGYKVSWLETDTSEEMYGFSKDVKEKYLYLNDLKPWTNYTIQVLAFNIDIMGDSLPGPPSILHNRTLAKIPEPPVLTAITILSPNSAAVEWLIGDVIYPGPTNYTVEIWEKPAKCTGKVPYLVRKYIEGLASWNTSSTVVGDLKPHTVYLFRLVASTNTGSIFSNFSMAALTGSDVPGPPQNFKVNCSENSTSVILKWESPNKRNGNITEYRINFATETNGLPQVKVVTTEPESSCEKIPHSTKLENLRPEINYRFAIQAKTFGVKGYGPSVKYSEKCVLRAGIPPLPENASSFQTQKSGQEEVTIVWSQDMFSSKMGRIVRYSIIVTKPEYISLTRNGSLSQAGQLPTWAKFWEDLSNVYQTTPAQWNPFAEDVYDPLNCEKYFNSSKLVCTIGWEKNCSSDVKVYCNGRLKPGKRYGLKIRGFTRGGFSETLPLTILTAPSAPPDRKSYVDLLIGLIFAFLTLALGGGCFYVLSKRKLTERSLFNEFMVLFRKPSMQNAEPSAVMSSAANGTAQVEMKPPRAMNFTTFLEHIKIMTSDSDLKFSLEYEELKQNSPRHPCTAAALEENRPKNRWMNIFPFDRSRVKLLPIDDEPGSDYINASYIPGFSSHREYIASQGPLPQTVDDFWRMVWEQRISMIVMLTQCVERGKTKCEQYWPTEDEYVYHADLKVQKKSISILPEYTIRIFDLTLGTRQRTVNQMHFTRWPDFGCPESPEELINFVRAVRAHLSHTNTGPILVHCSAGVGRTGTFIAVDRLLQYIQYHNFVDIYGTVMDMRDHRINMVQTENQYIYIHKCIKQLIVEKLKVGSSNERLNDDEYCSIDLKTC